MATTSLGRVRALRKSTHPASGLVLPTLSFVLAMTVQSTFMFFLAPAHARVHGLAHLEFTVFAGSALATVLVSVPAGRLTDLMPRRTVLTLGWCALGVAPILLAVAPASPVAFVAASAVAGSGFALGNVAFQSYVADVLRGAALARGYGLTTAVAVLGSSIGPFASAAVVARAANEATGVLNVALVLGYAAAAAAGIPLLLKSLRSEDSPPGYAARVGVRAAFVQAFDPRPPRARVASTGDAARARRSLTAYCIGFGVLGLGYGLTHPWLGPHLLDAHALPQASWGALLGVTTVVSAFSVFLAGRLGARTTRPFRVLLVTNGAAALMLAGFAFAPTALVAGGFFILRHFFGTMTNPVIHAALMQDVGDGARGRSLGAMNLAWNLPWAAGAAVGGAALSAFGVWLFLAGALVIVAGPFVGRVLVDRAHAGDVPSRRPARATATLVAE